MTTGSPSKNILIFDSGIGGLSIADEIMKRLPQHSIIYIADNRLFPYGIQTDESLLKRAKILFPELEAHYSPTLIVIACNSASTLVLDDVRLLTQTPIIGVVPAIKPAAKISKSGTIGLLATKGTVDRAYTQELINQFASRNTVISVGSDILVAQAEQKLRDGSVHLDAIKSELTPLLQSPHLDVLVLGCTHFPLLREEIQSVMGSPVTLIDSGEAIARRSQHILSTAGDLLQSRLTDPKHTFIFTSDDVDVQKIAPTLRMRGFSEIHIGNH